MRREGSTYVAEYSQDSGLYKRVVLPCGHEALIPVTPMTNTSMKMTVSFPGSSTVGWNPEYGAGYDRIFKKPSKN